MMMHLGMSTRRMATLLACVGLGMAVSSCATARLATPADMQQLGNRTFPGHSVDQITKAAIVALRMQGYEVVTGDAPRIRTAPKLIAMAAAGSRTYAQAYDQSVAWDLDVTSAGDGAVVNAKMRATMNGAPMEQVYYDWVKTNTDTLFKDIADNIPK